MKFTTERGAFLTALSHVQSVVERRNTIPILSNIMIEAEGSEVTLTATDLDLSLVESAAANVGQAGGTTLPAHTLFDIVRKIPDGSELGFSTSDGRLALTAGRSRFDLSTLPREDFPMMTGGEFPHRFTIAAEELKRLLEKTRFAVSTEETRHYLNGIYLHVTEDEASKLRGVATDGHRLAKIDLPVPGAAGDIPGVIIPRKAVGELFKLLDAFEGDIDVALSEAKIRFDLDGATMTTKLIDATFPDYQRVIPSGDGALLTVGREEFRAAVDRVATLATEKTKAVKLSLNDGRMVLAVHNPENGTAEEELEVGYEGDQMEIGFNARYLTDILDQIDGDVVECRLADSSSPTLMRDAGDDAALYVLMPMRV